MVAYLAAAARTNDTTLTLAGDVSHIPEQPDPQYVLCLSPGTDRQEFITYERRVGNTLIGVRRGAQSYPQPWGEYVHTDADR